MSDSESAPTEPQTTSRESATPDLDDAAPTTLERQWAFAAHLSALIGLIMPFGGNLLGPLIIWQLKKNEMPFVDDQGKEALNFQITVSLAVLASSFLIIVIIGIALLPIVVVLGLVFTIIGAIRANNGDYYRYPFTLRLIS